MHIREIDAADEALTHRFWEIGKTADEQGRSWSAYWSWPAAREAFTATDAPLAKVLLATYEADEMVGAAEISLPRLDNTHLAALEVYVDPRCRRRGVGTTLSAAALDRVRQEGRRLVTAEVATPLNGPESPGLRLARRLGFETEVVDDMKVADLDATEPLWQAVLDGTEAAAEGYTLRSWWGRCPDDLVAGFCSVVETFFVGAPSGDLDVEPERWDEPRLREKEERFARAGRHETTTVAVSPDGEVVGMTEAMLSEHAPDRAFQGSTIVAPAHRGRRLGLRLKATNHLRLRERFPECRTILTGNADVNVAMNAVNDRLGFRPVEQIHEMQMRL
ncbi:MAG TPA: GNAT family N-acetyltransferase [Nocardioidaceae bacterium]|nr:GNAT family N-acetyltransferase [Nocardioidaceae bacterium]